MARVRGWQNLGGERHLGADEAAVGVRDTGAAPTAAGQGGNDRQGQARPVPAARAPGEALERATTELRIDRPGFADDPDPAGPVEALGLDRDRGAAGGVLEGVLDQVVEDRRDLGLPGAHQSSALLVKCDPMPALTGGGSP